MRVKLGFGETSNKRFLVIVELVVTHVWIPPEPILAFTYDHEDTFLKLVVAADLGLQETTDIVTTILLSCEKPAFFQPWIPLNLTPEQIEILQFSEIQPVAVPPYGSSRLRDLPFDFTPNAAQFMDFMMSAPTPFAVLLGPELRFCLSNTAYIDLIRRPPSENLQGKPIREILRGIVSPSYIALMEEVYRTGEPHVRTSALCPRLQPSTGKYEDRYYDFIYHPLRDGEEQVVGIMLQVADVTQRITMTKMVDAREDQLFTQWAELEAIYQNTAVGMALFDRNSHRIMRINQKQADIMGESIEQLLGKSMAEIPQHIPGFKKLLDLVDGGQTVRNSLVHEETNRRSDSRRSWLVNITPALGASGEVSALSSVFLEVPDEVLNGTPDDTDDLITDPLESTTDAIYVLDRNWNFIFLNRKARELLPNGDHLLGRNVWEEFPKASQYDAVWDNFNRTMTERIPTTFTYYYGDPLFAWWDVHTYPAKNGISAFFRNITKQRMGEEALEETEEKYRMSLDLNPQVPWTMDAAGLITDVGVRWLQLTGLTREETLGNGYLRAIHPDDVPKIVQYLGGILPAKLPIDIEFRILRRDMRYIWMRARGTPVLNEDGTINRYYGTTEDIDELKELREALGLLQTATRFN
jgi:PAS domain S-box-containing protein